MRSLVGAQPPRTAGDSSTAGVHVPVLFGQMFGELYWSGAGRPEWPSGPACLVPDTQMRKQRPTRPTNPSRVSWRPQTTAVRAGGPLIQTLYLVVNKLGKPRPKEDGGEGGGRKHRELSVLGPSQALGRMFYTFSSQSVSRTLSSSLMLATTHKVRAIILILQGN